jgi:hypothetical protein
LVGGARFHGEEVRVRGEEIRLAVGDALAASPEYDSEPCALIRQFPEQAEPLRRLLRELRNQGEPFVEAGRLALLADVSAFNIDGRPLGHVLLELVVATGLFALPASHALFGCRRSHLAFYRRYGFDVVEGTVVAWDASLRDDYAIIHGRRDAVPAARRSRLEALASELMRAGEIHLSLYGYLSSDAGPS